MEGCFRHIMYKYKNGNFGFHLTLYMLKKKIVEGGGGQKSEM